MNTPLTFLGVERKLFFVAVMASGGTFNVFGSLLGGLLIFAVLFFVFREVTLNDPQLLRILLNSSRFKTLYDPGKIATAAHGGPR